MTSTPLPPIHKAVLEPAMVEQLFFDLEHAAEFLGAVRKGGRHALASAAPLTSVEEVRAAWRSDATTGVQLRYRYAAEEWWDTLLRTPEGAVLIRINHTRAVAAEAPGA